MMNSTYKGNNMKKFKVYGTNTCTHCKRIKNVLNEKAIPFEFFPVKIDDEFDPDGVNFNGTQDMVINMKHIRDLGCRSIPQIFVDDKLIGTADDTIVYLDQPTPFRELIANEKVQESIAVSLNHIQDVCHGLAREGGWWDRKGDALAAYNLLQSGTVTDEATIAVLTSVANQERNPLELIALMHSELSEGLEGLRKDQMDDKLPHRKMIEVELADAIVRILDAAGGWKLDIGAALVEKIIFNITRADHQKVNREAEGGKKY